jgi:hypothetical protein
VDGALVDGVVLEAAPPKRPPDWLLVVPPPNREPPVLVPAGFPNENDGVEEEVVPNRPPLAGAVVDVDWLEAPLDAGGVKEKEDIVAA